MSNTTESRKPATPLVNDVLTELLSDLGASKPPVPPVAKTVAKPVAKAPSAGTPSAPQQPRVLADVAKLAAQNSLAFAVIEAPAKPAASLPVLTQSPANVASDFFPKVPRTLTDVGCSADEIGRTILKLLAARGANSGRKIAAHIRLLFPIVDEILRGLRKEQFITMKGEAVAGDFSYVATERGMSFAKEFSRECTYFGSTPVTLAQYVAVMKLQSIADQKIRPHDLKRAFHDLQLDDSIMRVLGPAVNSGRGMFLFGQPGNGKTSVAERIAKAFGDGIWVPRAIGIDGQIMRVFDPSIHIQVGKDDPQLMRLDPTDIDHRWVKVRRPTVVAGGELTMDELEVKKDTHTGICEAPLQFKSNGGVLLIDDFGRQRMPVDELLNRWIIPLEKRYDLLNLPSGKKVEVPFDQLVIFSTNLEPKDLVDDAFLRRIPYKIEIPNPTPKQFHFIFNVMCQKLKVPYDAKVVDYLIATHYVAKGREFRACHPRDLLNQIVNLCIYEDRPPTLTNESIDFAIGCYFSILS